MQKNYYGGNTCTHTHKHASRDARNVDDTLAQLMQLVSCDAYFIDGVY